ncbi:hypothetical protein FOZ63_025285 [Perkinsus olseni]|uniref:Uncharacterized protein n=1 Tax=Perkinsus olseni TaxID=32597 RepID=A0A7J6TU82_PEROL|nr:hypothetical protein FOZ63_025285 [Perkinsus olseni]KAF4748685.1 hypothetical protein FOZ62_031076 [Perkinsus olseni]
MRYQNQVPWATLTLLLILQANTIGGNLQPALCGKSDDGTRYYFTPFPKGEPPRLKVVARQTVDGFNCTYVRQYLKPPSSNVMEPEMGVFTVNDEAGCRDYRARPTIGDTFNFKEFFPSVYEDRTLHGPKWQRSLPPSHPARSTAERLWRENKLVIADIGEEPAPNGVYYGFDGDGLEVILRFDENSQLRNVEGQLIDRFNTVYYTMIGKAIHSFFRGDEEYHKATVLLEPVDPKKFNGRRESFSYARIDTIKGKPFDSSKLAELLGLTRTKKFRAVKPSARRRAWDSLRAAIGFRGQGYSDLQMGLLSKDDTDEEDSDESQSDMV